ncbi:hypothetical protein ANO14919_067250 [Xylariales sp. No.14919]|nr:hypothetical protein ANO14919_067250 [Xylariales sp. No.14919]
MGTMKLGQPPSNGLGAIQTVCSELDPVARSSHAAKQSDAEHDISVFVRSWTLP